MGNKQISKKNYELCEIQYEKDYREIYPWNEILKWGSYDLNVELTAKVSLAIVEEIKDITTDEDTFFKAIFEKTLDPFHFENNYVSWATELLKQIPNLSNVRYNVVPKLLSEEEFWRKYFATIKMIIIKNLFDLLHN